MVMLKRSVANVISCWVFSMMRFIKGLISGRRDISVEPTVNASLGLVPAGYYMPMSAEQLLNTVFRKQCLQQLWDNSALHKDLYERFYLQPLKHLITLMQVLPAAQQGEYAVEGGLLEVTLQTTTYAVRLAKGYMLPPGAAPEEQSAQNVQWNVVVFYAALWHYLPYLSQMEGEFQSGRPWLPGIAVPKEPYRFRFKTAPSTSTVTTGQSTMIAVRLLPTEVIEWLSTLPAAIQSLMLIASRQSGSLPVIDNIVREAVKLARGDSLLASSGLGAAIAPQNPPTSLTPVTAIETKNLSLSMPVGVEGKTSVGELKPLGENTAQVTEVLLSSALDTPLNGNPLIEEGITPEPVIGAREDIQALLSLMDVSVSVPASQVQQDEDDAPLEESSMLEDSLEPAQTVLSVLETVPDFFVQKEFQTLISDDSTIAIDKNLSTNDAGQRQSGVCFWQWFSSGIKSGEIAVNTSDARAHIVSGFVFVCVPDIFHLYIKEESKGKTDRNKIQKSFEKLGRHRSSKGQRFFIGHLYRNPEGVGAYRRINGYLIKANSLYGGTKVPEDSPLLVIP